jgi:hypothetical protein
MQSIIFAAVVDALDALKAASRGVPNTMLRDIQSVHRNATFADLPRELQDAIGNSVRSAFTQLLKEGYAVGPKQQVQQSRPLDRVPERERRAPPPHRRGDHKGPRGPRPGGRPGGGPGKGKPRG